MTSIIRPDIPAYIATLPRILALGAQITTAGFTEPASLALARTKLDEVTALTKARSLPDPFASDPETIAATLLHNAAAKNFATDANRLGGFEGSILAALRDRLPDECDEVVRQMRAPFFAALETVRGAVAVGITNDVRAEQLLATATAEQIDAYRDLPEAVATLDRIGDIRADLLLVAGVGPARDQAYAEHEVTARRLAACFIDPAKVPDRAVLDGFRDAWVASEQRIARNPHARGGVWLELCGNPLSLNTAAEAVAVYTK